MIVQHVFLQDNLGRRHVNGGDIQLHAVSASQYENSCERVECPAFLQPSSCGLFIFGSFNQYPTTQHAPCCANLYPL
jgi:hypothetical protein